MSSLHGLVFVFQWDVSDFSDITPVWLFGRRPQTGANLIL